MEKSFKKKDTIKKKKQAKRETLASHRRRNQRAGKHMKRYLASQNTEKMQIKQELSFHKKEGGEWGI